MQWYCKNFTCQIKFNIPTNRPWSEIRTWRSPTCWTCCNDVASSALTHLINIYLILHHFTNNNIHFDNNYTEEQHGSTVYRVFPIHTISEYKYQYLKNITCWTKYVLIIRSIILLNCVLSQVFLLSIFVCFSQIIFGSNTIQLLFSLCPQHSSFLTIDLSHF